MHHDLHALDTSHTWVPRANLMDEPNEANRAKRALNEARPTFYTKRSHDPCTCGAVMSHMTSQCHR